jgi:2-oxoglutarate ferredoxin oxidoreductase subunit delta
LRLSGDELGGKAKEVRVDKLRCKGCGICVEFCPTGVLVLNDAKATVVDLEKCIACNMCDLRCPDFAITVVPLDED